MIPKVIASECAAGLFPKNTLSGFEDCLIQGYGGIEFDIHLSKDGYAVIQHDYLLNKRTTRDASGNWLDHAGPPLGELTLKEIQNFDIGRYRPGSPEENEYPDYGPIDGETVPTFDSFLSCYSSHQSSEVQSKVKTEIWVELKTTPFQRDISSDPDQLLQTVLDLARNRDLTQHIVLLAFEWDLLVAAKQICPDIQTDFLTINPAYIVTANQKLGLVEPDELYGRFKPAAFGGSIPAAILAAGGSGWGPYVHDATQNDVQAAQALGLSVNLWGVASTDSAMDQALALGADSITLSRPDLLRNKLESTR